ncbi:MAG TPA: ABC-three component system protein [Clostridia bacterium]|nr:ABC-three component system protein [Clostridia bacterium]
MTDKVARRERYSADEKNEIVEYVKGALQSGQKKRQLAEQYGVNVNTINTWLKLYEQNGVFVDDGSFDATPSWSGYQYQGKVALYVILKIINGRYPLVNSCDICKIVLEDIEDFVIKNRYDDNIVYSIHQVKAHKSKLPSHYHNAISKVVNNISIHNPQKGFLHIINSVQFDKHDKDKIKMMLKLNEIDFERYYKLFSVFEYNTDSSIKDHCFIDEIEAMIIKEIDQYADKRGITCDSDVVYLYLLDFIDKHICKRHKCIIEELDSVEAITTCDICNTITRVKENNFKKDNIYWISHLKQYFHLKCIEHINNYIDLINSNDPDIMLERKKLEEEIESLEYFIDSIQHNLSDAEFVYLCRTLTPHVIINNSILDERSFKELINCNGLKDVFLYLVQKFLGRKYIYEGQAIFKVHGKHYLITTIDRSVDSEVEKVVKQEIAMNILNNSINLDKLYEIDSIITHHISMSSIGDYAHKFNDISEIVSVIPEEEAEREKYESRIMETQKIRVIDLNTAKKELLQ